MNDSQSKMATENLKEMFRSVDSELLSRFFSKF